MPLNFMTNAEKIRKEIMGINSKLVETKTSNYNSSIFMDICQICNKNKSEDTHHINYQCESDADGFFKDFHKDSKHNLAALCKDCHKKEHMGLLDIKGYKKTSHGVVIDYEDTSTIMNVNPECASHEVPITEDSCEKLRQYVKKGKCNWYTRRAKTNTFKLCIDEKLVIERISNILHKNIHELTDDLYNRLYDPTY
jgi:hypothetical protein